MFTKQDEDDLIEKLLACKNEEELPKQLNEAQKKVWTDILKDEQKRRKNVMDYCKGVCDSSECQYCIAVDDYNSCCCAITGKFIGTGKDELNKQSRIAKIKLEYYLQIKDLIKFIGEKTGKVKNFVKNYIPFIVDYIENLQEISFEAGQKSVENKWVECSEELPILELDEKSCVTWKSEPVLVLLKDKGVFCDRRITAYLECTYCDDSKSGTWKTEDCYELDNTNVIAWQQLPKL